LRHRILSERMKQVQVQKRSVLSVRRGSLLVAHDLYAAKVAEGGSVEDLFQGRRY
jgi:hypothetical protein